jgi:hypothetical protein
MVITSRFSANRSPSFILALSLLESDSACANLVAIDAVSRRVPAVRIREGEEVGIDLIEGNTVVPGHFVSHLYGLNPMRPQKLLRPGELLYFVKDIAV